MLKYLLVAVSLVVSGAASAAEMTASKAFGTTVVVVSGKMEIGDAPKFSALVSGLKAGIVILESDGGSLQAGIGIGREIRKHGLATWVSTLQGRCASACGFAWLAGSPRMLDMGSMIGFHAVSTKGSGKLEVTAAGNALAGAYMKEIGMSDAFIEYATTAAPESMTWLSKADIERLGLNVTYIDNVIGKRKPPKEVVIPIPEAAPRGDLATNRVKLLRIKPPADDGLSKIFRKSD